MRKLLFLITVSRLFADSPARPADALYAGWLDMYNLKFQQAHLRFASWEKVHPANPLGPVSHAAGYLFAEFARLGVLESELFVEDKTWLHRKKLQADPQARDRFLQELDRGDHLADSALASRDKDADALLAKSMILGLRADYLGMIEKQNLTPLRLTKESRVYSEKLLQIDPSNYDAYLGPGLENYLLSLKPAPLRMFLEWTGSKANRQAGVAQLRLTAAKGHLLEPFAKLLLAVAALRDKQTGMAKAILRELQQRFPDNPLYVKEIQRISTAP
jgi:hypothetical protein